MKKILLILALLCVSLQAQTYQFESAATGSSGISTATARQNTGWTSNGTLARDTLATNYAIFGAKTFGVGGTTQAQNARAKFNVLGRAANDTLAIFSNDGGGVVGDSSITVGSAGNLGVGEVADAVTRIAARTTSNTLSTTALLLKRLDGSTLLQVRSDGNNFFGNLLLVGGSGIEDNSYGGYIRLAGTTGAINMASANSNIIRLTPASQVIIGATATKANQAFLTVNANGTADTTLIVRNDKNATLDSTLLVHANADLQSASRSGFGVNTSGQAARAILNAASRAGGDSLLVLTGESNYGIGDSTAVFDQVGRLSIGGAQGSNLRKLAVVSGSNKASLDPTDILFGTTTTDYSERMTRSGNSFDFYTNTVARFRLGSNGYVAVGNNFASSDAAIQAFLTIRANGTADTLMMARNDKNSTLDSTAMVFADGSYQFGVTAGGTNAFSGTAEHDTVTVSGASVNDIYTVTIKGATAPAAADLFAVEALATGFAVHRSAAGTSGLEYYWRRERR